MKILVGYDGSNAAKDALALARKHAKAFDAEIEVVTSLVGGTATEAVEVQQAQEELDYAEETCKKDNIACKTHLLIKGLSPGEDLVQFAQEKKIDQIVIGVKRRSKMGKLLFGSNAQYVILNAPCPVVTVK
jgi:nucleotide-binding universal stress UspA family protein